MRIAILTLPLCVNFGNVLQCYALQRVLGRMGHDVSVLEQRVPFVSRTRLFFTRLIKTYILRKESRYYGAKTENEIVGRNFQTFRRKYMCVCHFSSWTSIHEHSFDAIVVGSDQVWRKDYNDRIQHMYLDFAKDWKRLKRVAYAASFGTDNLGYSPDEISECSDLLKLFDAVSMREVSGVELCKRDFGVDAVCCIDPTLRLTAGAYLDLLEGWKIPKHPNGLLCYFIDSSDEKEQLAEQVSVKKGLDVFKVNNPDVWMWNKTFEERAQLPIEYWIAGFRDADFVVTDSFHGCVFSILFNKPFIVIGNVERGMARFNSLLSIFHLENRLALMGGNHAICDEPIQWDEVNKILKDKRQESLSFLSAYLGD